jgi:hypothetical protein
MSIYKTLILVMADATIRRQTEKDGSPTPVTTQLARPLTSVATVPITVLIHGTTRHNIPDDSDLYIHYCWEPGIFMRPCDKLGTYLSHQAHVGPEGGE